MNQPDLSSIVLALGKHTTRTEGVCALELVAWIAGEEHTDRPQCCSHVLGAFFRAWNDGIADATDRTRIIMPFVPRLVGSAASSAIEEQRSYLALDWLVRVHTPEWLSLRAELKKHAATLRGLPAIVDLETARAAGPQVHAARAAAEAAAWDAAEAVAWDAAEAAAMAAAWTATWDAARAATWDATWDATRAAAWDAAMAAAEAAAEAAARAAAEAAAWTATWDAARAAAWDATWDAAMAAAEAAAEAAAWAALAPTVLTLQASATDLAERMLALK